MKKMILLFTLALAAALTTTAAALQREQQTLAEKMVRLHVVANSDTPADQAEKLQVRDAVLSLTQNVACKEDLLYALPQIEDAANQCLRRLGSDHSAKVSFGKEYFPTRLYSSFSLPAGAYTALRITIGAGEGQNWWCVSFPSICLCAASEMEDAAVAAGFTEREVSLITEDGPVYVFKFKTLELLQQIKQHLQKKNAG